MTLGCGAIAGNITGDNIGPLHLINVKRLAYAVRKPEEAFEVPPAQFAAAAPKTAPASPSTIDRETLVTAVEKYLSARGIATTDRQSGAVPKASVAAGVVDRFLFTRRSQPPTPSPQLPATPPAVPEIPISGFVCEADVREAIDGGRRIYIGPKTIVTPSARELGERFDILVLAQR
jgi:acetaldehyde dehydrogenase (acetylating)